MIHGPYDVKFDRLLVDPTKKEGPTALKASKN
jgi:hypothetical protein